VREWEGIGGFINLNYLGVRITTVLKSKQVRKLRLKRIAVGWAKDSKSLRAKCPNSRSVSGQTRLWPNKKELEMKKKYLVFIVALVGIVALNNCSPDNQSSGQPTYDASEGLKGAVEKIPIPENAKVTYRQDWNVLRPEGAKLVLKASGFRWVLKSGKSIDEVERFYESSLQNPHKVDFQSSVEYKLVIGGSDVEIKVDREDQKFEIIETRPPLPPLN
jgi:hypothetical protein